MYCHNCGEQLADGVKFCRYCGAQQAVSSSAGSAAAPQATQPSRPAAPAQSRPKAAAKKKKNPILYILLLAVIFFAARAIGQSVTSGKEDTGGPPSAPSENAAPDIPEGVPVLVDGSILLDSGKEGFEEEYQRQKLAFYAQIDEAIRNLEPQICTVSVLNLGADTLGEVFGYPYFWLDSISAQWQWGKWEGQNVQYTIYTFGYTGDAAQRNLMQTQLDAATEEYISRIPSEAGHWEAAKIIHDELIRRVAYDHSLSGMHIYDIYGTLVEGSAVCQGYAYAFSYLMSSWTEKTGRNYVQGFNLYPTVVSEDHGWNLIYGVPTNDSNLDVTWDDPDITDTYGNPYILYDFFGLSTTEIEVIDSHGAVGLNRAGESDSQFDEPFNYHKHEGYYLSEFDLEKIISIFDAQYRSGVNVLTVRFENQTDYDRIKTWQGAENLQEFQDVLSRLGYQGTCGLLPNDELRTFNVLLNYS